MYISLDFKLKQIFLLILLSIFFTLLILNYKYISIPSNTTDMNFKVAIDAGHGSIDNGTSYGTILEKDINLQIAQKLSQELKQVNITPIMTRTEDKLYMNSRNKDLRQRPIIANQSSADLFISLHANNYADSQPAGSQIFYKVNSDESKKLAEFIKTELVNLRNRNDRVIKKGDYYVLNQSNAPGVLIEVGFLSNPEDREELTDPLYQSKLANAIKNGIINYFQNTFSEPIGAELTENKLEKPNEELETILSNDENNTLYYISATEEDIYLIKKNMSFPTTNFFDKRYNSLTFTEVLAASAMEELINPSEGLISPLPEGTKINSIRIDDGKAELDLSIDAAINFKGGSEYEYIAIEAISRTLKSIRGIEEVKILIEGREGASLGGHIILDY